MSLLSCLLFAWYGLPFVSRSPNNMLVSLVNVTGVVFESFYVLLFLYFAPKKEKIRILGLIMIILAIFVTVVSVSFSTLHHNKRKDFCGFAAAISSVIMYASPLFVTGMVIQTQSVEYMPFLLSLCCFVCGIFWAIYGLLGKDPFVALPNGFGSLLCILQLILYATFYRKRGQTKEDADGSSLELGQSRQNLEQKQVSNQEDSK